MDSVNVDRLLECYSNRIYRLCYLYLKQKEDAEDAFQDVFIKIINKMPVFHDVEHENAWIIRVTINTCKDLLRKNWLRKTWVKELPEIPVYIPETSELLDVVKSLPFKYVEVIYLYYYECYSVVEISKIIKVNENTIYSRLYRAKLALKKKLEADKNGYSF